MRWVLFALLLLGLLGVLACGDSEEDVDDGAQETPSASQGLQTTTAATSPGSPTSLPSSTLAPTVPAEWETFTDPVLGFTLRYPAGLMPVDLTGSTPVGGLMERVWVFQPSDDGAGGHGFAISISANQEAHSIDEWVQFTACTRESLRDVMVSGERALRCTAMATETAGEGAVIEIAGSMLYISSGDMDSNEFDLMIGSIQR
jgi:hypothetical protein